jgi:polyhydroxyalkanoate synthesis regulator phasin
MTNGRRSDREEDAMARDEKLTNMIQDVVDKGATTVEEIHRAIADLPLEVMTRNGLFEQTAADVRRIQDRSIGAVYDTIREVNHRVGELASQLLEERADDESPSERA